MGICNFLRRITVLTLACAPFFVSAAANADPRGASIPLGPQIPEQLGVKRVQAVKNMEAWLRRLTGQFHYKGLEEIPPAYCFTEMVGVRGSMTPKKFCNASKPRDAEGMWDCVNVGTGAGMRCIIGSAAQRRDPTKPNMDAPTMILLGIDPDIPAIRFMQLDEDGIASEYLGHISDDEVIFRSVPCVNVPAYLLAFWKSG